MDSPDAPVLRFLQPSYTYVRARSLAENAAHFTLLAVEQDRVVRRALLVADPRQLKFISPSMNGYYPKVLWEEQGSEIGRHREGAPPVNIDVLYDICEKEILATHPHLQVRLHFDDNHELQHCGYLSEDCPDCPQVSIQSVVERFVPTEHQTPLNYLCVARSGLYVPGARAPENQSFFCRARSPDKTPSSTMAFWWQPLPPL